MKTQCISLFIAQTIVFKSKRIRLDLDCTVTQSWCEMDAVKIGGNWISPECILHTYTFIDIDPNRICDVVQINNVQIRGLVKIMFTLVN